MPKSNDFQIGGTHYKDMQIQPWDAIQAWGLGFMDGNVVKYIARWRTKGGVEDLMKAQHFLTKLIEEETAKIRATQTAVAQADAQSGAARFAPENAPAPGQRPAAVSVVAPPPPDKSVAEKVADAIENGDKK